MRLTLTVFSQCSGSQQEGVESMAMPINTPCVAHFNYVFSVLCLSQSGSAGGYGIHGNANWYPPVWLTLTVFSQCSGSRRMAQQQLYFEIVGYRLP